MSLEFIFNSVLICRFRLVRLGGWVRAPNRTGAPSKQLVVRARCPLSGPIVSPPVSVDDQKVALSLIQLWPIEKAPLLLAMNQFKIYFRRAKFMLTNRKRSTGCLIGGGRHRRSGGLVARICLLFRWRCKGYPLE